MMPTHTMKIIVEDDIGGKTYRVTCNIPEEILTRYVNQKAAIGTAAINNANKLRELAGKEPIK